MYGDDGIKSFLCLTDKMLFPNFFHCFFNNWHNDRLPSVRKNSISLFWFDRDASKSFPTSFELDGCDNVCTSFANAVPTLDWTIMPLSCDIAYSLQWLLRRRSLFFFAWLKIVQYFAIVSLNRLIHSRTSFSWRFSIQLFKLIVCTLIQTSVTKFRCSSFSTPLVPSTKWSSRSRYCVPIFKAWYFPKTFFLIAWMSLILPRMLLSSCSVQKGLRLFFAETCEDPHTM